MNAEMRETGLRGVVAVLFVMCAWSTGAAEATTLTQDHPQPIAFLQENDVRARELLEAAPGDTLPEATREALMRQINQVFDLPYLSRLTLGDYWDDRTPDERDRFVEVFSSIIQKQNFETFVRYYRDGDIRYHTQEVAGDTARVYASVPLRDEEVAIEYALHTVDGSWRVYDLVVDGVSTAAGNRRRYSRYIERHSYEKLIEQLEQQLQRLHDSNS